MIRPSTDLCYVSPGPPGWFFGVLLLILMTVLTVFALVGWP